MTSNNLKVSRYNVVIQLSENRYILYNTLRNTVILLDREALDILQNENFEKMPNDILQKAINTGIIIDKNLDELNVIKVLRKMNFGKKFIHPYISLTLLMTYSCNLACPYCYEGNRKHLGGILTPKKIDVVLSFVRNYKLDAHMKPRVAVSFYGGEPLLNWKGCKYTLEQLEEMKDSGEIREYSASFTTNGTLITDEVIGYTNEYNVTSMQITLDGPKDIHDKRRIKINGEGTFDEIIENAKRIKENITKNTFYLNFRINIDKTNYKRIPKLLEYLKNEKLNDNFVSFGVVKGDAPYSCHSHDIFLVGNDLPEVLPYLWREAYKRGFHIRTRPNIRFSYCMYENPFSYLIDPKLDVYPCWEMVGIHKYRIGRIKEDGTFEPTSFYYDTKAREPTEFKECKNCNFLPICMGGCAAESIRKNGHPNGPGCDITRYVWNEGLKFYLAKRYPQFFKKEELTEILGQIPQNQVMEFKLKYGEGMK